MNTKKRLPNTRSLSKIIPSGTEGGKEFSRVVDLLIFQDCRRRKQNLTVFNDSAGDFRALDGFSTQKGRDKKYIGYQYKFYSSPLSDAHRTSIKKSLSEAKKKFGKGELEKWILVIPDDLTESAVKRTKGDVSWFNELKEDLELTFEIEYFGHTKLQALFLETPSICLFYYPELVQQGTALRKTIEETRAIYDQNLIQLHRNIDFVGMSIYKPEATRGIPMEHIYIPLNLIPETLDDNETKNTSYHNPEQFLTPGSKTVILGDPGSGKSTLLKFLALGGITDALQTKYNRESDDRLTLYIVLRKYADELKSKINLSLIDYILESNQAAFSLKSFDQSFLNYYLETGRTILFFDGLDELPDSKYKLIVKQRIDAFTTTYPGNTTVVSSRIVGYDGSFRLERFEHYKVAKLRLPEMERFVQEWYAVRIDNAHERNISCEDLVRILRDDHHVAIRELAENPLLLTIVALVHRIDAVLPDERVVLYQKCTETLLNTWHNWKFKSESNNKGRIERRNQRRMEAIAFWMQDQSVGIGKSQRSVVSYPALLSFLTKFISDTEKNIDQFEEPEDLATDFIEFIKDKAGLLLEVGDQSFSFVHLTFQEYLTATYLMSSSEKDGIKSLKSKLVVYAVDPRWFEVIRLLVAGLKSENSQEFIIDEILKINTSKKQSVSSQLLGGLLLDGVSAALARKEEILRNIITAGVTSESLEEIRQLSLILKNWASKEERHLGDVETVFQDLFSSSITIQDKIHLLLFSITANLNGEAFHSMKQALFVDRSESSDVFRLLFASGNIKGNFSEATFQKVDNCRKLQYTSSLTSTYLNMVAAFFQSISYSFDPIYAGLASFNQMMVSIAPGTTYGPFLEFTLNCIIIGAESDANLSEILMHFNKDKKNVRNSSRANRKDVDRLLNILFFDGSDDLLDINDRETMLSDFRTFLEHSLVLNQRFSARISEHDEEIKRAERETRVLNKSSALKWQKFSTDPKLINPAIESILEIFKLTKRSLWFEAIRVGFLPAVSQKIFLAKAVAHHPSSSSKLSDFVLANLYLLATWLKVHRIESIYLDTLIKTKSHIDSPYVRVAKLLFETAMGNTESSKLVQEYFHEQEYAKVFDESYWKGFAVSNAASRRRIKKRIKNIP